MSNSELICPWTAAAAGGGRIDAGQQLQQRALARPVVADDPQPVAFVDRQVDVFQGLDLEGGLLRAAEEALQQIFLQADAAEAPHVETAARRRRVESAT